MEQLGTESPARSGGRATAHALHGRPPTPTQNGRAPVADVALDDPSLYLNRELSWLEFDRRVLAQATDARVPLLERVRFVAIFADNLDEFFQVRVAGLKRQVAAGVTTPTADGRTPEEQLAAVAERTRPMVEAAAEVLHEQLVPLLARNGVVLLSLADAAADERVQLDAWFESDVFPVLTPWPSTRVTRSPTSPTSACRWRSRSPTRAGTAATSRA